MKRIHSKKGFTLVELIVVIVIIAILAATLVTSLVGYINKARESTALTEAGHVYTAMQAYVSEKNTALPTTAGGALPTGFAFDDDAVVGAIKTYVGTDAIGTVTDCDLNSNYTITKFVYTATNGKTVTYDSTGWVVSN